MAVVRHRRKFRPTTDPLPRGAGQPKSAGDGHYLYLQTQFGEYRCTQFRVIVVTDPQTHTNIHTHKHTDRTDYNTLHVLSLVRSVTKDSSQQKLQQ